MSVRVAVVGATGAVGTRMLELLERRGYPASEVVPFASERSAGRELKPGMIVQPLNDETIRGFDVAIFSAGGGTSREWSPRFAETGAIVVDNSSAFRLDDDVPLVVAEVNPDALDKIGRGIVANPNCTTMQIMLPLKALHDEFGLQELVATSYQAVGGAGQSGIDELVQQTPGQLAKAAQLADDGAAALAGVEHSVHADVIAFNVVPWLGSEAADGYSDEELKLMNESRKILAIPELRVSPTCVRVPVLVGHAVVLRARFADKPSVKRSLEAMRAFPGIQLDDRATPVAWAGRNDVAVGRVRPDLGDDHALNLWVVGDNLLKGAALNTVQIAELLHSRGLVGTGAAA